MNRQDEVAAVVFCSALELQTINTMKSELLDRAKTKEKRPDPETRLGLALIALTTPDIKKPTAKEEAKALKRVYPLWTHSERVQATRQESD